MSDASHFDADVLHVARRLTLDELEALLFPLQVLERDHPAPFGLARPWRRPDAVVHGASDPSAAGAYRPRLASRPWSHSKAGPQS